MAVLIPILPYIVAAGAAVSAVGAIQQGRATSAASKYNATLQEQNAVASRAEARQLAEQQSRENYLRLGSIHAAQAKSGGAANEGSVLDVLGDVAAQGELQKQQILYAGEVKAHDATNTAGLDRARARFATTSSYFQAGSDLLAGGAAYYSNSLLKQGGGPSSSGTTNYANRG